MIYKTSKAECQANRNLVNETENHYAKGGYLWFEQGVEVFFMMEGRATKQLIAFSTKVNGF